MRILSTHGDVPEGHAARTGLFAALPPFPVTVYNDPIHLMVPVVKNDNVPPKDDNAR